MKILITSGGTKVPIDPVRSISNMSTGRFGAAIAKEALCAHCEVIYLTSIEGLSPFTYKVDTLAIKNIDDEINKLKKLEEFKNKYHSNYHEYRYKTFNDYAKQLKNLIEKYKPDVVVLAAAVSDYLVSHYSNKKIKSNEELTIPLGKAPKIINQIKNWLPQVFLVGFKLLIDATDEELVATSLQAMQKNNADIIIANNLVSIQEGRHEILIVEKNGDYKKMNTCLAEQIIKRILLR